MSTREHQELPLEDELLIVDRGREFEDAWKSGTEPLLRDFVQDVNPRLISGLLLYLIQIDISQRGLDLTTAQDFYFAQLPDHRSILTSVFDELARNWPTLDPHDAMSDKSESGFVEFEVIDGPCKGERKKLTRHDTLFIGRSNSATWALVKDRSLSRDHLRIEVNPPECYMVDVGSTLGTFVNNRRTSECYLNDGDVITCGTTKILARISGHVSETTQCWEPTTIPGFDIESEIGRGNMGVVYKAKQIGTDATVAVKILTPKSDTKEVMQLFIREAGILNKLSHPGIVQSKEFGMYGESLYLVMEYINAVSFGDLVAGRSIRTRIRRSCAVACQVLRALHYAHKMGLVHRDVKPANVLLSKGDGGVKAKLADFGLAKNFESAGLSGISSDGQLRGTPAFMAPDQVYDCRASKPSVDIYAVAATLYFWLTGCHAIDLSDNRNWFVAILQQSPTPIQDHVEEIPSRLAFVIHRALSKDPSDRFPSAAHFVHALQEFAHK